MGRLHKERAGWQSQRPNAKNYDCIAFTEDTICLTFLINLYQFH